MDKKMNDYLEKVEKYLKPLTVSERVDIVKEIKSEMIELNKVDKMNEEQILARLGDPKELAKAYLGEAIAKNPGFNGHKLAMLAGFYSIAGLSGLIVLPVLSTMAVALMICAVVSPVAGLIKFAGGCLGMEVPFIAFQIGPYTASAWAALPISIVLGVLLFLAGKGFWKLTVLCVRMLSRGKKALDKR